MTCNTRGTRGAIWKSDAPVSLVSLAPLLRKPQRLWQDRNTMNMIDIALATRPLAFSPLHLWLAAYPLWVGRW